MNRILVLDFGSQYNQLIVRRIRQLGVYAELRRADITLEEIREFNPVGLVLSGGPASVYDERSPRPDQGIWDMGLPILGICYGMQVMVHSLGGKIVPSSEREYGKAHLLAPELDSALLDEIDSTGLQVWMSHGDKVQSIPSGFRNVAATASTPYAIIEDSKRKFFAMQFHPEVRHTMSGERILHNFIFHISGARGDWKMKNYLELAIEKIHKQVDPEDRVILGLSGGVDSSVMAALLDRALGDKVTCVFVDNGLLRLGEVEAVKAAFSRNHKLELVVADAEADFLKALEGITDPELKRKAIGETFIRVFEKEVARHSHAVRWLAQGTIYPDVIESTSTHGASVTIKSHHNVGGLPEKMNLKILEPLRELFKDEVRALGRELGLPSELVDRHPFPGPGLGVRILGDVTKEKADLLRHADSIYLEEIHKAGIYHEIAQAFAVLLPVKTVGVMGDGRSYEHVLALRAVTTEDFMTADWFPFPPEIMARISNRIVGEVVGVNRVVYDVTSKPPGTIEWE